MNISRFTDYSLRVLTFLATRPQQQVTIAEVASHYRISKNHLMKVVQLLGGHNYVTATRGKHGGITLERPLNEINIGALVRLTEQGSPLVECMGKHNECVITAPCQLKHILAKAQNAFYATLDNYTLADLVNQHNKTSLIALFGQQSTHA